MVCLALIALAGAAAYFNICAGDFVWDDKLLIQGNRHIKDLAFIKDIFREDLFHMSDTPTGYFRPIQIISYMADYFLWGNMPFGYHITSILLQIFNSSLVFFLCLLIIKKRLQSLFVSLVFCVHPAFVAIAGYISGRADLLGMAFSMLSIYFVIRYMVTGKRGVSAWLSIPCYALAVLSKEYYFITPLFIILFIIVYSGIYRAGKDVKFIIISMFIMLGIYAILRATVLNFHQPMGVIADQPFLTRLAIFPWIIARYIGTLLFPIDLGMEKRLVYTSLIEMRFVMSYLIPIAIIWVIYRLHKAGNRDELFFLGWFVIGILPVANLIMPLKAILADHWTYMPSVGIFAFLALLAGNIGRPGVKRWVSAAALSAVIIFIAVTLRENRYWMAEDLLYTRILQKNAHSSRTIYNIGRLHEEKGDDKAAMEMYTKAIEEAASNKGQYFNARGMLYKKMGDIEKANRDFEAAVKASPSVALYRNNLGCSYGELGMAEKARAEWEAALKINPDDELARKNLDVLMARQGG